MVSTQAHHQTLKNLLTQQKFADAEALWLDLAEQLHDQSDFLLLLIKEFADASRSQQAAELAGLLAPSLKDSGKNNEWLYALKLQAHHNPDDKSLRSQILAAYRAIYESDSRFKSILAVAQLDVGKVALPTAMTRMDTLLALTTGAYCHAKSWGVGRVKQFDTALNRLVVAFAHNPDHAMQLAYAADNLQPISADHIEVRKLTDAAGLKQLAASDPVALVRTVLVSHHHAASADRIEAVLSGSVIPPADWKKWWEAAKKQLKRNSHFEVPAKRTDPIILRSAPVSQQDELLESFRVAPSLQQKNEVARQFLKILEDVADPALLLQEFQDGLLTTVKKTKADYAAERLEAAFLIEDMRVHQTTPAASVAPLISEILAGVRDLPQLLEELTTSTRKRVIATEAARLIADINRLPAKTLDELTSLLETQADRITNLVRNHTASPELLCWICRKLDTMSWLQPVQSSELLHAIVAAIEAGPAKSTKRLRDLLFSDEELIPTLLANADTDTVRDISRLILASPAFEELDRRSLMARIVKEFPFVQEFLVTKTIKEAPLIVSKASYDKRRAELDEIISKRIPENSKEIGVARSYGDLRENFEFKAAKDLQKVLMRRRAELEILLSRAQTTDFSDAKTDLVSIGTSVVVTDLATGQRSTYHILGAWDSDPARGIISYPAALAKVLLNRRPGDEVEAAGETGAQRLRIEEINKVPGTILAGL